jgi:hypothetical protein
MQTMVVAVPQLRCVLKYYSELEHEGILSPNYGHELAGALLSSSKAFLPSNDK